MRQVEGHDDPPFTTDTPEFLLTLDLRSEMAQTIWDTPRPPGLKARRERELLDSLLRATPIRPEADDFVTEQRPHSSLLRGRADAMSERRVVIRTPHSAVGPEATSFNPPEHSTPSLYPSQDGGTLLLGRKTVKFMKPVQDDIRAGPSPASREEAMSSNSTPIHSSKNLRAGQTSNSKKLVFDITQNENEIVLDDESAPAWVIGTPETKDNSENNVHRAVGRGDKGKGKERDTGYGASMEGHEQSILSAGENMSEVKDKSREVVHGVAPDMIWQQIFPNPEQAKGKGGSRQVTRSRPTARFAETIPSPNPEASEAGQSDASGDAFAMSQLGTGLATVFSDRMKAPEERQHLQEARRNEIEPEAAPGTYRKSGIISTSSPKEAPRMLGNSQITLPPQPDSGRETLAASRQSGGSLSLDLTGASDTRYRAQPIPLQHQESQANAPFHSFMSSPSKATSDSEASGRMKDPDVARSPRQITSRHQETGPHSSLSSPAADRSRTTPAPVTSDHVLAPSKQSPPLRYEHNRLPTSTDTTIKVPGAFAEESVQSNSYIIRGTSEHQPIGSVLPESQDGGRHQLHTPESQQPGDTAASMLEDGERGRFARVNTNISRTPQESVSPEPENERELERPSEVLSRYAHSSGPSLSRAQPNPPSTTTGFQSRTPEVQSIANESHTMAAIHPRESEPPSISASGSRPTERLRSWTEERSISPSRAPFSRQPAFPYEIPRNREEYTGSISAPLYSALAPLSRHNIANISAPLPAPSRPSNTTHLRTSVLKALPGLFDANGPVTQTGNGVHRLPDASLIELVGGAVFRTAVMRFQHDRVKFLSTRWTVSQWATDLQSFTISDSAPGDVHFHRNLNGMVNIWMNISFEVWVNCTNSWLLYNSEPILHPSNNNLILDSWGTNSWIPNYIARTTYIRRKRVDGGLVEFNASLW